MNESISIAGLTIQLAKCPAYIPRDSEVRDWVNLHISVETPFSKSRADGLQLPLPEILRFRKSLQILLASSDLRGVALGGLMPSFDLIFSSRGYGRFLLEIRMSPELRLERHMYDFDVTESEVRRFVYSLENSILSIATHVES